MQLSIVAFEHSLKLELGHYNVVIGSATALEAVQTDCGERITVLKQYHT